MPISLRDVISKQFLGCIFSVSSTCLATCLAHKHSYNPSPPKRTHTHTLTGSHLFLCSPRFPQQPWRMISLGWQVCLSLHISATRAPSLHPNAACSTIGPLLFLPIPFFYPCLPDLILALLKVTFPSNHNNARVYFPSSPFPSPSHFIPHCPLSRKWVQALLQAIICLRYLSW